MSKWNGKNKAITFSFDDGVHQDKRLIDILNKYDLKCTFNINSELLGVNSQLVRNDRAVRHDKFLPEEIKDVYSGHEIAAHGCKHCDLTKLTDEQIIAEIEGDRLKLSQLCGYEVVGMAYAGGCVDNRVVDVIKNNTGIKYSRMVGSTRDFTPPTGDLLKYQPTIYYIEKDFEDVVDKFLLEDNKEPKLLYIWGHSFEMDVDFISWENFERICKKLAFKNDIFYGTNREVLL